MRRAFSDLVRQNRKVWPALAACLAGLAMGGCGRGDQAPESRTVVRSQFRAELARTSHGIAHVRASDFRGIGYGLAFAYAQDNVCMFADTILTVRGERARFFGADKSATPARNGEYGADSDFMKLNNEDSDFFFKGYLDAEQLKAGYAAGSQEARDLLTGYAAGYNRYLKEYAGRYPAACNKAPWVRPITYDDMMLVLAEKALHASGQVFAREIVDGARDSAAPDSAAPDSAARDSAVAPADKPEVIGVSDIGFLERRLERLTREQLGSNGLALGKEVTASGRGILLGNPHYPWTSTDRFYQAHLTIPGRYDAMGAILGGIPMIVIGFNKDVAWTHTVTRAVHFTTFRLALDTRDPSGTTYLYDGSPVKMSSKTVNVDSLRPDGSMGRRSKTFYFTKQGAVLVKPDAGISWSSNVVHALGDANRHNTRLIEQWIGVGSAKNVGEIKASLDRIVGLPWVNTMAADRDGNVLYADASVVPKVGAEVFASDCFVLPQLLMFDGSRRACAWGEDPRAPAGVFSPAQVPWMTRTDYVGNSNDSYWLTTPRALLTGPAPFGYSPLYGQTGVAQMLRTRIGFRQLEDALANNGRLGMGDVQELAFANRVYAAELMLPEFLPLCGASVDAIVAQACRVLSAWDRHANLDSRGAVLFREFWNRASLIPDKWAVPLDPADPVNTPRGLAPATGPAMLAALKVAAQQMQALSVPLDGRLGDYQGDTRNDIRVPLHGAIGDIDGSYNSIHMETPLQADGYHQVVWGTSYVQTVTFDEAGPVAHAMLLYGQSVDPTSPYHVDQLPLYSQKIWPLLPFTPGSMRADPRYSVTTLSE
ncbi:penicillin acylase family protein [Massilia sp. P8910]|uniref:penicillin acylase family protein n=1 Tax=Massilia antarctica TaxID=2765360 RepID=UPI001E37970E|nr:penicillin acylase family protein [Massilia antarctica]MCE3607782.1 penicillin acylase family protein [Massilia antarctica]